MNQLKRLALVISIATVLAGTAQANEINSLPCANPGTVNSPPCATQLIEQDNEATTFITEVEVFILEATARGIESLLTIF